MINRTEIIDYARSDHFKKRARQRFGISKAIMKAWITNIVARGSFSKTNQDGIWFLDDNEVRIVADVNSRNLVTVYSLHDCVWLAKRSSSEIVNKDVVNEIIVGFTETFDILLRKQNKKISSLIKALNELECAHSMTKRKDYYSQQEDKICELEEALAAELVNKRELVKITSNMLFKE